MNVHLPAIIVLINIEQIICTALIKDNKQNGKVISKIQPCGIKMCAKYCLRENRCKSFNFEMETLTCEFLSDEDVSTSTYVNGYYHGDISKWPQDVAWGCSTHNCSSDERCIELRNGATTCVKIGCAGIQYTYNQTTDMCFHVFLTQKTMISASQHCQVMNGRLVVLNTQVKADYFPPEEFRGEEIFIGLDDTAQENAFKWVDGSSLTYAKWHSSEPNNFDPSYSLEEADCVVVNEKQWFDRYCLRNHAYACERPDLSY